MTGDGDDRIAHQQRRLVGRIEKLGIEVIDDGRERPLDADLRRGDDVGEHAKGVRADEEGDHDDQ